MRRISEIADGNAGVYQTADKMRALIHRPSPRADRIAFQIRNQHPGASSYQLAAAVHAFILKNMKYVNDDPAIEELFEPELLFSQLENRGVMQGDCDDFVMATCSLLKRLGVPCNMVLASSNADQIFDHVYAMAMTEHGPVSMDGIYGQPFGWEHSTFTKTETVPT